MDEGWEGKVKIELIEGKDMEKADVEGTSDCYCIFSINWQTVKSSVFPNSLNPVWNETFELFVRKKELETIQIVVKDEDKYSKHDDLGSTEISLKSLTNEVTDSWYPLSNCKSGQLHLKLSFLPLSPTDTPPSKPKNTTPQIEEKEKGESYKPLKGSVFPPSNYTPSPDEKKLPKQELELEMVHGYRGNDCRENLFLNKNSHLVYHTAAVAIIFDPATREQRYFKGHNDDISSMAMHPNREIFATGQVTSLTGTRNPKTCIWNSTTLECTATLEGFHQRGVIALSFTKDGNYLVSVGNDDKHSIAVYDLKKNTLVANSPGHANETLLVKCNPNDSNTFITCGSKHIKFWKLDGNKLSNKDGLFRKQKVQTLLCACYTKNKNELATGAYDGDIFLWQNNEIAQVIKGAHSGPVYSITCTQTGNIVSGGKDGRVAVWNIKSPSKPEKIIDLNSFAVFPDWEGAKIPRTLIWKESKLFVGTKSNEIYSINTKSAEAHKLISGHFGEFWGLAAHPTKSIYVTGGNDCTIRLWDVQSKRVLKSVVVDSQVKSLAYSPDGKALAASTETGDIFILDDKMAITKRVKASKVKVNDVKFSPNGKLLAAGSNDGTIEIFSVDAEYQKITSLTGNNAAITHLDFTQDSKGLQSDSVSMEHLFWDLEDMKQATYSTLLRDAAWDSFTCVLGWHVRGIWPKGSDGTDVNGLCKSSDSTIVATADDFGLVKLFRYPVSFDAKYREYTGHSAHVTNVRFTVNDTHVISIGGNDKTVFQWRVKGKEDKLVPLTEEELMELGVQKDVGAPATPSKGKKEDEESLLNTLQSQGHLTVDQVKFLIGILNDTTKAKILDLLSSLRNDPNAAPEVGSQLANLLK